MSSRVPALLLLTALMVVTVGGAAAPRKTPVDPSAQRLERKYGKEFLTRLKALGCTPTKYVYALRLTKVGLEKLVEAQYEDALYLFRKAYGIVASPNLLFYRAMTHKGMGRPLKARTQFLAFLREVPRWTLTRVVPGRIARAKKELSRLEGQLATLTVITAQAGFTVRLGGIPVAQTPMAPRWLRPGTYRVSVARAGYVERAFSLTITAGERVRRTVQSITQQELARRNRLKVEIKERRRTALLKRRLVYDAAYKRFSYRRQVLAIIGWSALAAGGAALLTAGYYGLASLGPADAVESAPRDTWWVDVKADYEQAEQYRTNGRVLAVSGAILAAAGTAVLLYCHRFLTPPTRAEITTE